MLSTSSGEGKRVYTTYRFETRDQAWAFMHAVDATDGAKAGFPERRYGLWSWFYVSTLGPRETTDRLAGLHGGAHDAEEGG